MQTLLDRKSLFVASSRLPQKLDSIPEFFAGLLKLAVQLDSRRDVLLTIEGTACHRFVVRIAELFGIPMVALKVIASEPQSDSGEGEAYVVDPEQRGADEILALLADQVTVLSMRKGGNLYKSVTRRLENGNPTRVLVESGLTKKALTDQLLSSGATGWFLFGEEQSETTSTAGSDSFVTSTEFDATEFLLHWTRRRVGPWPGQSDSGFLDDLIFGGTSKDHRQIASLRRILATGRIFSSNGLTRDPRPVVCFSDIIFEQLAERRVFRPHLSRWDFEPFGIAIKKTWLAKQGARKVTYGEESVWESLEESERPWFQLNQSEGKVDWSLENEWRILGDVDLRNVPVDAAVVFVPTQEDAQEIASFCRWPIVVLSQKQSQPEA